MGYTLFIFVAFLSPRPLFYPEDGGSRFYRYVNHVSDYTSLSFTVTFVMSRLAF
jgi:hypothetical protein